MTFTPLPLPCLACAAASYPRKLNSRKQQTCWTITKSSNCTNNQQVPPVRIEKSFILDDKLYPTYDDGIAYTVTGNSRPLLFRRSPYNAKLPNFLAQTCRCCRSITSAETSWCIQRRVSAVILNSSFWPNKPLQALFAAPRVLSRTTVERTNVVQ